MSKARAVGQHSKAHPAVPLHPVGYTKGQLAKAVDQATLEALRKGRVASRALCIVSGPAEAFALQPTSEIPSTSLKSPSEAAPNQSLGDPRDRRDLGDFTWRCFRPLRSENHDSLGPGYSNGDEGTAVSEH